MKQQQSLMKAASYGKAFCGEGSSSAMSVGLSLVSVTNDFVATAKKLRILNDVRHPSVGLLLTVQQYNRLTPEVLVGLSNDILFIQF